MRITRWRRGRVRSVKFVEGTLKFCNPFAPIRKGPNDEWGSPPTVFVPFSRLKDRSRAWYSLTRRGTTFFSTIRQRSDGVSINHPRYPSTLGHGRLTQTGLSHAKRSSAQARVHPRLAHSTGFYHVPWRSFHVLTPQTLTVIRVSTIV